jgi:hypothetical protein
MKKTAGAFSNTWLANIYKTMKMHKHGKNLGHEFKKDISRGLGNNMALPNINETMKML